MAHAADLAFATLAQHEAKLVFILPLNTGRQQQSPVQTKAVAQKVELSRVQAACDAYQIFLLDLVCTDKLSGEPAVLGEDQQALRIDIQAAGGRQSSHVRLHERGLGTLMPAVFGAQ